LIEAEPTLLSWLVAAMEPTPDMDDRPILFGVPTDVTVATPDIAEDACFSIMPTDAIEASATSDALADMTPVGLALPKAHLPHHER
jgi:hypothetical protein